MCDFLKQIFDGPSRNYSGLASYVYGGGFLNQCSVLSFIFMDFVVVLLHLPNFVMYIVYIVSSLLGFIFTFPHSCKSLQGALRLPKEKITTDNKKCIFDLVLSSSTSNLK